MYTSKYQIVIVPSRSRQNTNLLKNAWTNNRNKYVL